MSDVAVVTNDAGQRDGVEVSPLGAGEHAFPLPPKPRETKTNLDSPSCIIIIVILHRDSVSPVPISQRSELSRQQAGQERSDSTSGESGLGYGPHPHIDVVRCPVQELEFVSQSEVAQDFGQF